MAVNRFILNGMSFHGHGAINEIPGIVKGKGFNKPLFDTGTLYDAFGYEIED